MCTGIGFVFKSTGVSANAPNLVAVDGFQR